ncbi:MAG: FeoA family protein, partial [Thermoguttaceae bacterium]
MPNSFPILLSRLSAGDRAVVVAVEADQELQGRLMGMGLFAGSEIEVLYGGVGKSSPMRIG